MEDDDETMQAAVMAMATSAVNQLQSASLHLSDLLDGDGPGAESTSARHDWWDDDDDDDPPQGKQRRKSRARPDYSSSAWGTRLKELEHLRTENRLAQDSREAKDFRADFRVPYEFFLEFVEMVRPVFPSRTHDVAGRPLPPLELKVLGALQVLGRGNCFADVANFSLMSRSTAEKSFHRFCDCFSAGLWHQWVRLPEGDDLKRVEGIYSDLGFPGAVGSIDCTHVAWERCSFSETNNHKGKEGYTSLVYEAICDHAGRILASTRGFPGAENDKTVVKRDRAVARIRDEDPWKSYKFTVFGADGETSEQEGGWIICDGGYHRVPLLICPFKVYANINQLNWSKRLESVRKDIECFFGRLKGRFRLFKTGVMIQDREKIDNAWFTACIIHNMLHACDGLANLEKDMDWAGKDGEEDETTGAFPAETEGGADIPGMEEDADDTLKFHNMREKMVCHFTYKRRTAGLTWVRLA